MQLICAFDFHICKIKFSHNVARIRHMSCNNIHLYFIYLLNVFIYVFIYLFIYSCFCVYLCIFIFIIFGICMLNYFRYLYVDALLVN